MANSTTSPRGLRIGRLALKELRETLRDRRTIITLFAMPLLVYPILSLIFRTFLFSTLMGGAASDEPLKFTYIFESELSTQDVVLIRKQLFETTEPILSANSDFATSQNASDVSAPNDTEDPTSEGSILEDRTAAGPRFLPFLKHEWIPYKDIPDLTQSMDEIIQSGEADVGIRISPRKPGSLQDGVDFELVVNEEIGSSRLAAEMLEERLNLFNLASLKNRLQSRRISAQLPIEITFSNVLSLEPPRQPVSFAAIVPLMLVLMTITGAVYPAIDLTAGERERGTLETLIAAPIPRISILVSKFIAVLTVAVLTATLNVIGILVTVWAFQLDSLLGGGLTMSMVAKVFALLILFAGFFSALLLAVTSYARSFKEAQAYLIPIILLSLAPGLMALTPGLSLNGPMAVVPMVNILILARDVLENQAEMVPAVIAVLTTILYGFLAILAAAKIFGTDAILYGSQGSWKDLLTRPNESKPLVSMSTVITCLALLFPVNFVLIGFLGRFQGSLTARLLLMGFFTLMTFMVFPYLITSFQRVKIKTGFALRWPRLVYIIVGVVLGCCLWPLVMSIITSWQYVLEIFWGEAASKAWHDRLIEFGTSQAENIRKVHPAVIAISFAFLPALCEEWFFRGFLMRSLLKDRAAWLAILISAVVFGLFHVLSNSVVAMDRLLPTTIVGLILGWLCYRSGSIIPGILLHMLHNGILTFMAYYEPQLSRFTWFPEEGAPIPTVWIVASALISIGCIVMLQIIPVAQQIQTKNVGSDLSPASENS